jgi:hypothetical protein
VPGQSYVVEGATDVGGGWQIVAAGLLATNNTLSFSTNFPGAVRFFRGKRDD